MCLWQEGEGQGIDGRPTRGFAGQIFFFTGGTHSSVAVNGDVRIFLFDDDKNAKSSAKPLHQFDFVDESWKTHMYSSQFGPVYRIFVPYTRKGMSEVNAALRVRLQQETRTPLFSDLTAVKLAGQNSENEAKLGQAAEFHDHRILQRNGAVKITKYTDGENFNDYLKNNTRTLGTQDQGEMVRDSSFENRVLQANHEARDKRTADLERQFTGMLEREKSRNSEQDRYAERLLKQHADRSDDRSPQIERPQHDGGSGYDEPARFSEPDDQTRSINGGPMSYPQAVQRLNQLQQ
jgi:hypothetical protein